MSLIFRRYLAGDMRLGTLAVHPVGVSRFCPFRVADVRQRDTGAVGMQPDWSIGALNLQVSDYQATSQQICR